MKEPRTSIEQAFLITPRENFVRESARSLAHLDEALPIGFSQTISQPTTVRMMLEWLDPQVGDHILDVGSGSGWTTALLSSLVGPRGKVDAVELVPELVEFGENNCARLGLKNVFFHQAGSELGWSTEAPYDRILVSAAADSLPQDLLHQLKPGGKLIIPVQNDILEITKGKTDSDLDSITHPGFVFVPLIEK